MNAWLNKFGVGAVLLSVLACGSKGEDGDDGDDSGTGATGSGGTGTGGSATGGTSGSATGGSGGGTSMLRHGFADGVEGWIVQYTSSGKLIDMVTNAPVIDKSTVMLEHIVDDGDPEPGALQATIPYTTESQYAGFGVNYMPAVDLSSSVMTARVKLVSGLADPAEIMTTPGGAKLYAKSGSGYCYAAGEFTNVSVFGAWMTIRFDFTRDPSYVDMTCAAPFDPSEVLEIGIQIDTGSTTVTAETAVVNIDSISY